LSITRCAPAPFLIRGESGKRYRFAQIGAHDLQQLDDRFDVFYPSALDHIPDWPGIFKAVNAVAKPGRCSDQALLILLLSRPPPVFDDEHWDHGPANLISQPLILKICRECRLTFDIVKTI